ncbi:hypothetical protein K1719_008468 [Acacia pycnantha]|nr:hypothetical protein K1719_008468 [Acacia pycnantha]
MCNKHYAVSKNNQIERGVNQLTMNCPGTVTENELPTVKSSLLNPLSSNHIQYVLTDITNTPNSSNCMQRDDSCLTYRSTLNVTHTVRPRSQSVNQKKRGKTHLPQIRELATDLCKSLDIPLHENSRAANDQHDTSTPYMVVDNNLTCTFHSNYLDDGDTSLECQFCGSQMWFAERLKGLKKNLVAQFGICCCKGKIIVPLLKRPPEELEQLFFNKDSLHAKKFLRNICLYNMFSFTSMGGGIDHSINSKGGGPYSFVLSGQNHHLIGSLLPPQGNPPVYAQLYIYDTENEVSNRISTVSHVGGGHLDQSIVEMLKECLDKHNCVVKHYRNAAEIIKQNVISDVSIRLIRSSNVIGQSKQYNMPTTSELAALIVGDFDNSYTKRDIIVKRQSGSLQRIDELHMAYLPLQYPLLFPYGDNGYDSSNEHAQESLSTTKKKKKLTPREYMAFCLMRRKSERLDYIRKHQKDLRVDLYSGLTDVVTRGETDPSSTGQRAGYPDIFLTFTCNPMWPEITRHCEKDGLKPCDKPEILSRVFHMKLDKLMRILKDEKILGSIKADVYIVEFQKRGLPHAHIILCWELHGSCGQSSRNAPCMKDGKCSKYFPKRYNAHTILDEKGYPTYRRRNDGRTVSRKGVKLDNRFVVPYIARLLKLFCGHLNIEKTNQLRAIKYLFKYISKGNDRVIAGIYNNNDSLGSQQSFDEVSHYLNCRYVSSCEALWRIFGFEIHHRHPPVERLAIRLNKESIYYTQGETMFSLVNNPRVKESMFLAWFEKNKDDPSARTLTYSQFPNHFTFVRKKGFGNFMSVTFQMEGLVIISSADKEAAGLSIIEKLLLRNGRSLNDYPSLPTPDTDNIFDISNQFILQELNYNKLKEREESERLQQLMTAEQKQVFDEIMGAVS